MTKPSKQIRLHTGSLSCTGCALDMETLLNNTDGILKATVTYATGMINIVYDPEEIEIDRILSLIRKWGMEPELLPRQD